MIDVVIPARNEEATIRPIVNTLRRYPRIAMILVMIDAETTDNTAGQVNGLDRVACIEPPGIHGKGQLVTLALREYVATSRVMFCDADITGLNVWHVARLTSILTDGMIVGVPDLPDNLDTLPSEFDLVRFMWAWPWVSGLRSMPTATARTAQLHGYLMETQLNAAARLDDLTVTFARLRGCKSPLNMNKKRIEDMERDALWGREHGILGPRNH